MILELFEGSLSGPCFLVQVEIFVPAPCNPVARRFQWLSSSLLPFQLSGQHVLVTHSDLLPSASSPVHVEVLQGRVEMHQGRILRSCYDVPCQSVVQSHYNVNTDIIRTLKTE